MNVRSSAARETQINMGIVNMTIPLITPPTGRNLIRHLAEQIEYDRKVVRTKIPYNIDCALRRTEIDTSGVHMKDLSQCSRFDLLLHPPHTGRELEDVADRQSLAESFGQFDKR